LAQALNINDRGKILGLGVPPGAPTDDFSLNFFGHVFVLLPCHGNEDQGCRHEDGSTKSQRRPVYQIRIPANVQYGGLTGKD
jgi:hypothetical protein